MAACAHFADDPEFAREIYGANREAVANGAGQSRHVTVGGDILGENAAGRFREWNIGGRRLGSEPADGLDYGVARLGERKWGHPSMVAPRPEPLCSVGAGTGSVHATWARRFSRRRTTATVKTMQIQPSSGDTRKAGTAHRSAKSQTPVISRPAAMGWYRRGSLRGTAVVHAAWMTIMKGHATTRSIR
jgi:hypothetical protein